MKIESGNKIKVHYIGTLNNGDEFDNSYEREGPIDFVVGEGQVIQGFEAAVIGMEVDEVKEIKLTPDEAYGDRIEEAITIVNKSNFPEGFKSEVGDTIQGKTEQGMPVVATIKEIRENEIVLDMNHPLAGEGLTFVIKILEINKE